MLFYEKYHEPLSEIMFYSHLVSEIDDENSHLLKGLTLTYEGQSVNLETALYVANNHPHRVPIIANDAPASLSQLGPKGVENESKHPQISLKKKFGLDPTSTEIANVLQHAVGLASPEYRPGQNINHLVAKRAAQAILTQGFGPTTSKVPVHPLENLLVRTLDLDENDPNVWNYLVAALFGCYDTPEARRKLNIKLTLSPQDFNETVADYFARALRITEGLSSSDMYSKAKMIAQGLVPGHASAVIQQELLKDNADDFNKRHITDKRLRSLVVQQWQQQSTSVHEHTTPNCWASDTVANAHLVKHSGAINLRECPYKPVKPKDKTEGSAKELVGDTDKWEKQTKNKARCTRCNWYHAGECTRPKQTPTDKPTGAKAKEDFPAMNADKKSGNPKTDTPKDDNKSGFGKGKTAFNPGAAPHVPSSDKEGAGKGSG